jgi:hypothetical protein
MLTVPPPSASDASIVADFSSTASPVITTGLFAGVVLFCRGDQSFLQNGAAGADKINLAPHFQGSGGSQSATVANQTCRLTDAVLQRILICLRIRASGIQLHGAAGQQIDAASVRSDQAFIDNLPANQGDSTAAGMNRSLINDAGIAGSGKLQRSAVQKRLVGNVQHRSGKTIRVDDSRRTHDHTRRIHQIHVAVGIERAVNARRIIGRDHSIQHGRIDSGLIEVGRMARVDIKAVPVDDGAICVSGHIQIGSLLSNRGSSSHDHGAILSKGQ